MGTNPTPTKTGKTATRWYRLWVDGYSMSGLARSIGSMGVEYRPDRVTGWQDPAESHTLGHPAVKFENLEVVFSSGNTYSSADAGSWDVLNDFGERVITLAMGIRDYIVEGDPCFLATQEQTKFESSAGNGSVLVRADFRQGITRPYANPFGFALVARVAGGLQATTEFDVIDLGSAHSAGAVAHLHTYGGVGTVNWAFTIEHSTTGAFAGEEATWHTFSADGSAATAEVADLSDSLDRYIRFVATRTSGVVAIAAAMALKV